MLADPRARRSYRQVADLILALIVDQRLSFGDRLPAERELAERLGVSRPSLREALIALEVEGRVDIRMGSGVYVAANATLGDLVDGEGPFEILEARAVVESAIAEEAARRVTPALVTALDTNLRHMAKVVDDRSRAIALDAEFHVSIASATGNALLIHLTTDIFGKRLSPLFNRLAAHFERPRTWRTALEEHREIRDAIAIADPAAAQEAMRRHLENSRQRFSETFSDNLAGEAVSA